MSNEKKTGPDILLTLLALASQDMMPILGAPILVASISGDDSRHIENMTDVAVVTEIMSVLFLSFPTALNPTSFGVTVCGVINTGMQTIFPACVFSSQHNIRQHKIHHCCAWCLLGLAALDVGSVEPWFCIEPRHWMATCHEK